MNNVFIESCQIQLIILHFKNCYKWTIIHDLELICSDKFLHVICNECSSIINKLTRKYQDLTATASYACSTTYKSVSIYGDYNDYISNITFSGQNAFSVASNMKI